MTKKNKKPYYQCFQTVERVVYCSSTKFRSHAEAKKRRASCMTRSSASASRRTPPSTRSEAQKKSSATAETSMLRPR
jgi:hypothetical protein